MKTVVIKDRDTGETVKFASVSEGAEWIKKTMGGRPKTNTSSLTGAAKAGRLYLKRFEVNYEGYVSLYHQQTCNRTAKRGCWKFWVGEKTPMVVCAEHILPFYDESRFEDIQAEFKPLGCVCYFDVSDDDKQAKLRHKCCLEVYKKFDRNLSFSQKIDSMYETVSAVIA